MVLVRQATADFGALSLVEYIMTSPQQVRRAFLTFDSRIVCPEEASVLFA